MYTRLPDATLDLWAARFCYPLTPYVGMSLEDSTKYNRDRVQDKFQNSLLALSKRARATVNGSAA